jgi:DNA-directed RNA polymerase specialized sigma24 family protein
VNTGKSIQLPLSRDRVDATTLPGTKELNAAAFNSLLARLDPDRHIAAEKYLVLRRKLVAFFEWKESMYPDAAADETIDRLARKVHGGENITNLSAYTRGVALRIYHERRKTEIKTDQATTELAELQAVSTDDNDTAERLTRCLDACLKFLPDAQRELIVKYYCMEGPDRIVFRSRLAEELQISLNTLRIRAHRIKSKLGECVKECAQRDDGD